MIIYSKANGTLEGMDWLDEQEPTIESFRRGSTNVLQEGLDVPICEKVILFDAISSITEFVQSKNFQIL